MQATAAPVLSADNLTKSFDDELAVDGVTFSVQPGEVIGILGPNGAGKTTTIRMLTTLLTIDAGRASIGGFDVETQPEVVRQLIGVAGQGAAVDEKLTARENLNLFARLYKLPKADRADRVNQLIDQFSMADFADRPAETYSGGQRRRLDVAAALVAEPPVLLLDEPTTGLDPRSRADLWDAIRNLAAQGTAIVLTTQYLEEADSLADLILIIDQGRVVAADTPAALKKNLERDVLEVQLRDPADAPATLELFEADARTATPDLVDPARVQLAVGDNTELALKLLRGLQESGIGVSDFQLRRPNLDDVFLALTGEKTGGDQEGQPTAVRRSPADQEAPSAPLSKDKALPTDRSH